MRPHIVAELYIHQNRARTESCCKFHSCHQLTHSSFFNMSMSSSYCNNVDELAEKGCNTALQVHKMTYAWTIDNFDFHEAGGSVLQSPEFSAATNERFKWCLRLKPNGETNSKNSVAFFLKFCGSESDDENVYAKFNAFILDKQRKKVFVATSNVNDFNVKAKKCSFGCKEFLKKDDYFRDNYLVNMKLTIICEVNFSTVHDAVSNTLHQCEKTLLYPNNPDTSLRNLSENLGQLLENPEFADVILAVDGHEYAVHKNILAARSPVFAAMLKHDMKENKQNRIDIEDMNAETVDDFLRYIYTGKCANLENVALGLLAVADKYQFIQLKMICAEELFKTLSVENAASILSLADIHGVKDLKNEVIKFILRRPSEVFNSDGWRSIGSKLVMEVCHALAER